MLMTTGDFIDGKKCVPLKIISGKTIRTRGWFGRFQAYVETLTGGKGRAYLSELKKAEEIAFADMEEQAKKLDADAVIGVDIDISEIMEGFIMCNVNGTAVKFEG